jgi:hypothetical protein
LLNVIWTLTNAIAQHLAVLTVIVLQVTAAVLLELVVLVVLYKDNVLVVAIFQAVICATHLDGNPVVR